MQRKRIFGSSSSPYGYLFLIVFLCSMFFTEIGFRTSNYGSRFFLTKAIVDHRTFRIDFQYPRLGTDYSVYRGHYFSDKPPGSSLMMIPQYILIGKPVEMLLEQVEPQEIWRERIVAWVVQISSVSLYSALAIVGLYRIFSSLGFEKRIFSLSLLSFFGTLMFPYSTVGTGEMFTAALVIWALLFLLKNNRSKKDLVCSGFFFGLGCLTTNQIVFLASTATALVAWQHRRKPTVVLYFICPMIAFFGLMLLYNWINFDSFLSFPVNFWRGRGNARNIWFEFPSLMKILDFFFFPSKGIFLYSPFLVFSIPGFKRLLKKQPTSTVFFLVCSLLVYVLFFLTLVLTDEEGPSGGHGFGFRYIVPVLPFLCIGAAAWMVERKLTPAEIIFVILSICICSAGAVFGYRTPLLDYNISFLLSVPSNNFICYFLERRFGIDSWLLRLFTTFMLFGCVGAILLKYRASHSRGEPLETNQIPSDRA